MKNYFYPIFDKARVDVVFSGHDHRYSRSYPIKREKIDEDGVIYFDMGSSGNKWRSFEENVLSDGLHASVLKIKEEAMTLGAICHVKKDEFSLNVYDINGNIQDSFSFKKKKR